MLCYNVELNFVFGIVPYKMDDIVYMRLAVDLAKSTLGQTAPNPVVGAVIVKDGQVLGVGAHLKYGSLHAEINALNMAGEMAEGATLYVTLEPCCHQGNTPACTSQIIAKRIRRVIIATRDPNPQVLGKGIAILEKSGIIVEVGMLENEATKLNEIFFHYIVKKTPFVTLKVGMSLDAKLATTTGQSKWITNSEARADAHNYRHTHDAIMVGINTVICDNPSLTTRMSNGGKNPIRIVLDSTLRTPLNFNLVTDKLAETWIITGNNFNREKAAVLKDMGVKIIALDSALIDLGLVLKILGDNNISSLFVEGGPLLHTKFIEQKLFNQLILYMSPQLIGGAKAPAFFKGIGFAELANAPYLTFEEVKLVGDNIKIIAKYIA